MLIAVTPALVSLEGSINYLTKSDIILENI
jgi:hypothetical protein